MKILKSLLLFQLLLLLQFITNSLNATVSNVETVALDQEQIEAIKKQALDGDAKAQFTMGMLHDKGDDVLKSYTEAAKWFQKSADQGYAPAQVRLAYYYETAAFTNQDYHMAAQLYMLAADQGNAVALNNLGCYYRDGTGVKKDIKKAKELFAAAKEKGSVHGAANLSKLENSFPETKSSATVELQPSEKATTAINQAAQKKPKKNKVSNKEKGEQVETVSTDGNQPDNKSTSSKSGLLPHIKKEIERTDLPAWAVATATISCLFPLYFLFMSIKRHRVGFFLICCIIMGVGAAFIQPIMVAIMSTYWMFYYAKIKNKVINRLSLLFAILIFAGMVLSIWDSTNAITLTVIIIINTIAIPIWWRWYTKHIEFNRCPKCYYYHKPELLDKELLRQSISRRSVSRDVYDGKETRKGTFNHNGTDYDVDVEVEKHHREKGTETTTKKEYRYHQRCKHCNNVFTVDDTDYITRTQY